MNWVIDWCHWLQRDVCLSVRRSTQDPGPESALSPLLMHFSLPIFQQFGWEASNIFHHTLFEWSVTQWEARNVRNFLGGSLALLLLCRRLNYSWSETRRCVLGVTCNKPMRVQSPIPFKRDHIWTWRVDILTARLQSPLGQMHDHMNFKLQMALFMAK